MGISKTMAGVILSLTLMIVFSLSSNSLATSKSIKQNKVSTLNAVTEEGGSIYAVYNNGKKIKISKKGKFTKPKLADDKKTIGYLDSFEMGPKDGLAQSYSMEVHGKLYIWRGNKIISKFVTDEEPFLWDWKFYDGGKKVVLKTGYPHGLGMFKLYDINTRKLLEKAEERQDGQNPDWAQGL